MKTDYISLVTITVLVFIVTSSTYMIFNPVVQRHHVIVGYVRSNYTDNSVPQNVATDTQVINNVNTIIARDVPRTIP